MKSVRLMPHVRKALLCAVGVASSAMAADYTVTGTIKTPAGANAAANNVPVKYIKVVVRDQGLLFDSDEAAVFTGADGKFTAHFTSLIDAPDVYINVEYVGAAIDGRLIKIVDDVDGATTPLKDVDVEGVVHDNIPPGTLALGVLRTSSTKPNIISHLGDSFRYVRSQYAGWAMPDDAIARARATNGASFVNGDGSYLSIAFEDWDHPGAGAAAFSDLHHESWHWIAYRAYGNRWPNFNCNISPHGSDSESCEGFAMQEGGAQYYGTQSAAAIGLADQKTTIPQPTDWRGEDRTGNNNNGEIVEGALERTWRLDADNPGQLRVMLADSPDSMKEFMDGYSTREGSTSAKLITFFNNASANGIVYTRLKMQSFTEGAPPNAAPPSTGNFRVISDIAFLRATVKPVIQALTRGELKLAANSAAIDPDQKDLGYKPAVNGLAEASTAGFTFLGPAAFASPLKFDTTIIADADYDLAVRGRNAHTWVDNYLPNFTGDVTAAVNTNEKWLKSLHTWFSQEATPTVDNKGKVIVDNTAPQVSNFKPQ